MYEFVVIVSWVGLMLNQLTYSCATCPFLEICRGTPSISEASMTARQNTRGIKCFGHLCCSAPVFHRSEVRRSGTFISSENCGNDVKWQSKQPNHFLSRTSISKTTVLYLRACVIESFSGFWKYFSQYLAVNNFKWKGVVLTPFFVFYFNHSFEFRSIKERKTKELQVTNLQKHGKMQWKLSWYEITKLQTKFTVLCQGRY